MNFNFKVFILILLLISKGAFSQRNINIDSLQNLLSAEMADTSKALLFEKIAKNIWNEDLSVSMDYAQQGLAFSKINKYDKGIVRCQNRVGAIYTRMGNHQKALNILIDALTLANNSGDLEGQARININLGVLFGEQGFHLKAIEYYKKALAVSEKIKFEELIYLSYLNIGAEYIELKKYDSGLFYMQKSYGIVANKTSGEKNVIEYNLGVIYLRKGQLDKSLDYLRTSAFNSIKASDTRFLSSNYYKIAEVFNLKNNLDSAYIYSIKANKLALSSGYLEIIDESFDLLSKLTEKSNPSLALEYFKKSRIAKDSLINIDKKLQIQKITFQEKLMDNELEYSKKELEKNQMLLFIGLILSVFAILSILLFIINKNKTKANRLLTEQKNTIEKQKMELHDSLEKLKITQNKLILQEKLASLGELTAGIAHEIQNPLNFVNNFSEVSIELINELQEIITDSNNLKNEEINELIVLLLMNQNKINQHGTRASTIVKNMLEHSRGTHEEITKFDLNKTLGDYLNLAYHGIKVKNKSFNAEYELISENDKLTIEGNKGNLERVFLNIFNNAFYAVNQKQKDNPDKDYSPKLIVKLEKIKISNSEFAQIIIEDNGVGIPENQKSKIFQPFFSTKPTGEGTGLGLSLSREIIVTGHNGNLDVESTIGEGSVFTIQLPVK